MFQKLIVALLLACICVAWVACDDEDRPITHDTLGVPIKRIGDNSLEAGGSDFYRLKYKEGDDTLKIDNLQSIFFMVTPIAGDVDLYVAARLRPNVNEQGVCSNCIGSSTTAHGDFVQIAKNSISWPTGDDWSFYILVKGAPDTISSYTLTVWISDQGSDHEGTVIQLEDGFPQVGVTLPMQYTYFKFKISDDVEIGNQGDKANDLVFILTPFNGDPDIFISTSADDGTKRPTSSKNFWYSLTTKTELINVNKDDAHYTRDGYYYIGIKAFGFASQAHFMLSATSRKRYTQLIESVSVESLIATRSDYNYFKYYMPMNKAQEILIAVSQIGDSDPDLFVYPELDYDQNNPPSNLKCKWCRQAAGEDSVLIPKDDAAKGNYYIGIRAWKQNTAYSLMAITERNNIYLRDGIPAIVPTESGKYKYFKYFNYDNQIGGISFSASGNAGSNIHLYYSKPESLNTHPTKEKHDLQGFSSGNEAFLILFGSQPIANHYFSVFSDRSGNVTVTAATNTSATILENLVPLPNIIINKNTYRYFIFDPTLDDDGKIASEIIINLGVFVGEADLFVSAEEQRPTKDKCTEKKNCWTAETFKADSIHISPNDTMIQGKTRLYISVTGLYYDVSFITIMAGMSNSVFEVTDGVSVESSVLEREYSFFSFNVPQKAKVVFQLSLTDEMTEANMYASKQPKPTKVSCEGDNNCYISERIGDDVIDKELEAGLWYISVHGISPKVAGKAISFQFKASSQYHVIQPSNRVSPFLVESTPAGSIQQIKVSPIFFSSNWLSISTSLISGHTRLYVNPNDTAATPDCHKYRIFGWPGNNFYIEKTHENEDDFRQTKWTVGVEAVEDSDYWLFADYGSYYTPPSTLPNNIPRTSRLANITRHFTVDVDTLNTEDVYINLRIMSGGVKLIIGQNYTYPVNPNDGIYYYEGTQDRLIFLSKDQLTTSIPLKITVSPLNIHLTNIELTVSRGNAVKYVVQDQPQNFLVDESTFLLWNSKSNPKALTIKIESDTLDDAPVFYVSSKTDHPDENNYEYKSRSDGDFRQIVNVDAGKLQYHVGLSKKYKGQYATISASTRQESTPIISRGVIGAKYLFDENGYSTFRLTIPNAKPPKGFEELHMVYDLYSQIVGTAGGDRPIGVNMKTVGGIHFNMKKIATFIADPYDTRDVEIKLPNVSSSYVYQVNVIAHIGFGLQTPYDGFWIVNGDIYPNYPNFIQALMVSPGTVLLILFAFIVIMYFLIGSIVNIFRGRKGLDVIPQRAFWTDLPYLVLDGFKFIATCGRRSTSYNNVDDEVDNDIGQLNLGTKNARAEESDEDMGGYGAI